MDRELAEPMSDQSWLAAPEIALWTIGAPGIRSPFATASAFPEFRFTMR
jgi:hypothetical protein